MNFNIDLTKLGELPMGNLLIVGIFSLLIVFVWRLPNILSEWRKFKQGGDDETH